MGIGEVTPRQLAPSVGTTSVGSTTSMASSPWIYDSSAPTEEISVDNLNFTFHSEAAKPAFKDLSCDLDVYFGNLSYRLTAFGMLRFPDQIRSTSPDPIYYVGSCTDLHPHRLGGVDAPFG